MNQLEKKKDVAIEFALNSVKKFPGLLSDERKAWLFAFVEGFEEHQKLVEPLIEALQMLEAEDNLQMELRDALKTYRESMGEK